MTRMGNIVVVTVDFTSGMCCVVCVHFLLVIHGLYLFCYVPFRCVASMFIAVGLVSFSMVKWLIRCLLST